MFQDLPPFDDVPLENQRVLVRVDLDDPCRSGDGPLQAGDGTLADDAHLRAALPTLERVVAAGARLIVAGHRGVPGGEPAPSLEPVAERLAELTGWEVHLPDSSAGDAARKVVADLRAGQVCCLENLLGEPGELDRDEAFARELARLTDVYVLDSLALADREWASVTQLPRLVKHAAASPTLLADLERLGRLLTQPARPFVAILAGSSLEEALPVIAALRGRVDTFCFAGELGHTLLAADELQLGATLVEPASLPQGRTLLGQLRDGGREVLLPVDLVAAGPDGVGEGRVVRVRSVPHDAVLVDIGPETIDRFRGACTGAGTVLWMGAVGLSTSSAGSSGGRLLATSLAVTGAFTAVVGVGAASAARSAGQPVASRLGLVTDAESTVRTALLGQRLPALEALL